MATKKKPPPTTEFVRKNHDVVARAHYDIQRLGRLCAELALGQPVTSTTMVQFPVGEVYTVSVDLTLICDQVAQCPRLDLYVPEALHLGGPAGIGDVDDLADLIDELEQALADWRRQAEKEERPIAKLKHDLTPDEVSLLRKVYNRV